MCERALTSVKIFFRRGSEGMYDGCGKFAGGSSESGKIFVSGRKSSDADHVRNGSGRGAVGKGKQMLADTIRGTL